jgi:trehalose 6-phosphate synthase
MHDYATYLNDCKFILVSNREPYEHIKAPSGKIEVKQPAGGLVTALDPTMRRTHGTWVAWGSGSGDRETSDEAGRLQVPPGENEYSLRRVWLDDADVNGYYHGFANRALWPLCHMLIQHFEFRTEFWERYRAVNLRFAHAVADEAERCSGRSMAWIQDYHFGLAAEFLRAMRPSLFIHQFWHIPFPPPDILRLLPSGTHEALLRGLLGNDLMEFQIDRYAQNFLECVDRFVPDAKVDRAAGKVLFRERTTEVGAFPISIDVPPTCRASRSGRYPPRPRSASKRSVAGTRKAIGSLASASIASTTPREFPSACARSRRYGKICRSSASNSRSSSWRRRRAPT